MRGPAGTAHGAPLNFLAFRGKVFLACSAYRADPAVRHIFELGPCCYSVVWISGGRIIDVTTNCTYPFLHCNFLRVWLFVAGMAETGLMLGGFTGPPLLIRVRPGDGSFWLMPRIPDISSPQGGPQRRCLLGFYSSGRLCPGHRYNHNWSSDIATSLLVGPFSTPNSRPSRGHAGCSIPWLLHWRPEYRTQPREPARGAGTACRPCRRQ